MANEKVTFNLFNASVLFCFDLEVLTISSSSFWLGSLRICFLTSIGSGPSIASISATFLGLPLAMVISGFFKSNNLNSFI